MSKIPKDAEELGTVYSNFDHRLDDDLAKKLEEKSGKAFARHAAWNFCGYVWHADGQWHNETWTYGHPAHVFVGESVQNVVEQACDQHGRD